MAKYDLEQGIARALEGCEKLMQNIACATVHSTQCHKKFCGAGSSIIDILVTEGSGVSKNLAEISRDEATVGASSLFT